MKSHVTLLASAVVLAGLGVLAYAANEPTQPLAEVRLPPNSCSITCPATTTYRGRTGPGGGVSCDTDSAPVCQCQDETRPIAGCEPLRKSNKTMEPTR
jgi:hypothetical protein